MGIVISFSSNRRRNTDAPLVAVERLSMTAVHLFYAFQTGILIGGLLCIAMWPRIEE